MSKKITVDVHHLARVEGHGDIRIRIESGKLIDAAWEVVETPRFFEAMLVGKHYSTAPVLTARICGICSIGHALASLRGIENALGVAIPDTAAKLRLLAKHGETLQSHFLHLFFLAAPDFLGLPSVLPLLSTRPAVVALAAKAKGIANHLCDAVAGRTTHPVSFKVGGMSVAPDKAILAGLKNELAEIPELLKITVEIFQGFEIPDFARETEFVSLKGQKEYPWIGGRVVSSDGVDLPESSYREITNEFVTENNTSKWSKLSRDSYAVGALARFNNNFKHLAPAAKSIADFFRLSPVSHNPFMHNIARLVEVVHCLAEARRLVDELLDTDLSRNLAAEVTPRAGSGTGAVEVPRGILFHHYELDDTGRIAKADCVIPTTQNNANIHYDLVELARQCAARGLGDKKIELMCSMLVRAYDPCISCSVH